MNIHIINPPTTAATPIADRLNRVVSGLLLSWDRSCTGRGDILWSLEDRDGRTWEVAYEHAHGELLVYRHDRAGVLTPDVHPVTEGLIGALGMILAGLPGA